MENNRPVLLDGAMGTMLQAQGLPVGKLPEEWNIECPERVTAVHRAYVEAGAKVLYTNTFGANRYKFERSRYTVAEAVKAAVAAARAAGGEDVKVALDIGPLGKLLSPLGETSFDEAYEAFREIVLAGAEAGADLAVIETQSDIYEVKAAMLAVKENSDLPMWVTMTFEKSGRTFTGTTVSALALCAQSMGAQAVGFNCSLGPKELIELVKELTQWTDLPVILKPNAGLPDPATGKYGLTAEDFAALTASAAQLGAKYLGGCCGTDPSYIRALGAALEGVSVKIPAGGRKNGVCTPSRTAEFGGINVIGERLNPTGKPELHRALLRGDFESIAEYACEQEEAGAQIINVNVGIPEGNEAELMKKTVLAVQEVCSLPLMIDSSDPAAIEAGLRWARGRCIANSVSADPKSLERILPLCQKYGAAVVGLTVSEKGLPRTAAERIANAEKIVAAAEKAGLRRDDVLIDCLTLTVCSAPEQTLETIKAVEYVSGEMKLHTVLGVSNVSFGLPKRTPANLCFLTRALFAGLDMPIVNPLHSRVMDAIAAFRAVSGRDEDCGDYIERFAPAPPESRGDDLTAAVLRGSGSRVRELTGQALQSADGMTVIEQQLIPALDEVGAQYESGRLFLPQLMKAAAAACEGLDTVRESLRRAGQEPVSRGKVVLAAVKGDIHDIGKNIVRVVLSNYGYTVIDLGRDVPAETVVETVIKENVRLVGLSALMTTTVPGMAETVRLLHEKCPECKVMVGGAVLTEEYAKRIGADYYARDAKSDADIAAEVLG